MLLLPGIRLVASYGHETAATVLMMTAAAMLIQQYLVTLDVSSNQFTLRSGQLRCAGFYNSTHYYLIVHIAQYSILACNILWGKEKCKFIGK